MNDNKIKRKKGYVKTYVSGFIRAFVIALLLLLQFGLVFLLSYYLSSAVYIYFAMEVIGVFAVVGLVNQKTNASFKIGWLVIITLVPIAGLIMYFLWGANRSDRINRRNMSYISYGHKFLEPNVEVYEKFVEEFSNPSVAVSYLQNNHFPLYDNNEFKFYPTGDEAFDAIIEDLGNAEKFIFLEFFIVADGVLWNRIKPILIEKAKKGVEIKFLYDDYGSMFRTSKQLWQELRDAGIETEEFNPIGKYLDKLYLNYRTHQKIVVIDGKVGYTGGFNLADEYVNEVDRFGVWKDNGVRIEGEGVFGLTAIFLQMWTMTTRKIIEDYSIYKAKPSEREFKEPGYCQIIADGPANNPENPIADTILQLIYGAREYLYITTPYLILDDDIMEALAIASKRGTDVRIITPGIPDKKIVNMITRHSYGFLLKNGVRIYEYTPGFIHAKTIVSDECSLVGTINMDFRSLFIHYECGALMWNEVLKQSIKNDFFETIGESHEVTYEEWKNRPVVIKILQNFFALFSSLM